MDQAGDIPIPEQARELLTGMRVGYVSTSRRDGHLGVVPVGVVRDGDVVRFSSQAATEKVRSLRHDPRVTLCVPTGASRHRRKSWILPGERCRCRATMRAHAPCRVLKKQVFFRYAGAQ